MSDRSLRTIDIIGGALLVLIVGTAIVVASVEGGEAAPVVSLLLAVAAFVVVGRVVGRIHRALIPATVTIAAGWLAVTSGVLDGRPLGGPFGYRNATGAFYVQATVAALMVAAAARWRPLRVLGIAAAVWFAAVAAAVSSASAAALVVIAVVSIALVGPRAARRSVVAVALIFVTVLAGTIALGAGEHGGDTVFARVLTERRLTLWHESLLLLAEHPGGVGPGRFQEVDPTALRDRDARWAHNGFLQQGVELGWAGLVLVISLFVWGFVRLWARPGPDLLVALGAASLAALGIHASVDYVLHFPAVPLAAAALVGTAQAGPFRRSQRDHDDAGQEGIEGDAHPVGMAETPATG